MNKIVVAAAGSGKTTKIVEEILEASPESVLITTYTLNNVAEIKRVFWEKIGVIPDNVTILSWFSFLLNELARPYQNYIFDGRIESIMPVEGRSAKYVSKKNVYSYFFAEGKRIYTDKISEFSFECNERSSGLVIDRLTSVYNRIYVDEAQDLSGYDLEIIDLILKSEMPITLVGDHRQATYSTNCSPKNKQFRGLNIIKKFQEWEKQGFCLLEYSNDSFRCHPSICAFADSIHPETQINTVSRNERTTGHDGVFVIPKAHVDDYIATYQPQVLRYDKKTDCLGYQALNFGDSKGLTFERVLIFPNLGLKRFLESANHYHISAPMTIAKLYVAVTRAKQSVAFVNDEGSQIEGVTVV